jgi:hypothetical protein
MTKIRSTDSKRVQDRRPESKRLEINRLLSDTNRKLTEEKQPGLYPGSMKPKPKPTARGASGSGAGKPPVARKKAPSYRRTAR